LDEIDRNPMRAADPVAAKKMTAKVLKIKVDGDSAGGIVEAVVRGCPAGLGEPVFDKLEADLAKALLSIPAVKGFEIGSGFAAARMRGSEHNDAFYKDKKSGKIRTRTNFAGGVLGGISDGEEIVVRVAVKPPSSIPKAQRTVDTKGRSRSISVEGRHDPCLTPRVVPVVESMIALVLADHLMRQSAMRKAHGLAGVRSRIDQIDDMLMLLVGQRQELVAEVGRWKRARKLPVIDREREARIMEARLALTTETGLDRRFLKKFFQVIIEHSRSLQ
jgi:chorismate synthase